MSIEVNSTSVELQIIEMRREIGAATDAELAAALEVNPSAISQWRKRGKVPDKAIRRLETIRKKKAQYYRLDGFNSTLNPDVRHKATMLALHFCINRDTLLNGQLRSFEYYSTLGMYAAQFEAVQTACAFMLLEVMKDVGSAEKAFETLADGPSLRSEIMSKALSLHYKNEGNLLTAPFPE
jgi:hypothetical protein